MNTLEAQNLKERTIFSQVDSIEKSVISLIQAACQEFWEDRFDFLFQSITDSESIKNDFLTRNEPFFIKSFDAGQNRTVIVRFSSNFVGGFLHTYLASYNPRFSLSNLTELEIKLFTYFAQFIYDKLKVNFVDYNSLPKEQKNNKGNYNLTLSVKKSSLPSGKILVTVPKNLFGFGSLKLKENFSLNSFLKCSTCIGLKVGMTKMTLSELKSLSKDDILLLEDSNINSMKIKTAHVESPFKVNPDPTLIVDLNENEIKGIEGDNMAKNVWDDIQIEVSAEFNKVKMTLGELKQLTSGLVVDLGDIFDNKISLVVEDKTVAKGNLIIINDKYGVRIDEIISDNEEIKSEVVKTNISKGAPVKEVLPKPKNKTAAVETKEIENDEDFDYSNVEDGE